MFVDPGEHLSWRADLAAREGSAMGLRMSCMLLLGWLLAGCARPHAPVGPADPPAPGARLRLAAWNVRDFYDEVDDSYNDDLPTHRQVEQKMARMGQVLRAINPDVVALEEVEKLSLLQRFRDAEMPGYQAILVQGNDVYRGINVALLSRRPVTAVISHRREVLPRVEGEPPDYHFSRDCLEIHLGGSFPMVVLVNHFKSKRNGGRRADSKRRAQALGVMRIVHRLEQAHPGLLLAVVGDLNDDTTSWALRPLRTLDDVFIAEPMRLRWTACYGRHQVVLDHILVNRGLEKAVVRGSTHVWRGSLVHRTSDHCPVSVDLRWPSAAHRHCLTLPVGKRQGTPPARG